MVKKNILISGMPGSGKSTAGHVAKKLNIPVLSMGDVIREEIMLRNITDESKNYEFVMRDIRESYGNQIVAERTNEKLLKIKSDIRCIEGIRSPEEVQFFKKSTESIVIAIMSPFTLRLKRLSLRERPDIYRNKIELEKRDRAELELGIGKVLALADSYIINNDESIENFQKKVEKILNYHINYDKDNSVLVNI